MQNTHIGIPELEAKQLSYEEFYRILVVMLKHELHYLEELYPNVSIDNIKAYAISFALRITKSAITLHSVIERDKDYVVANGIVRSLADSISSFILIYTEKNSDTRYLRHYLYIIDGLAGRLNQLPESIQLDGRIREEEFVNLKKQIDDAKINYEGGCSFCEKQIKELKIYPANRNEIDSLIKGRCWKFNSYKNKMCKNNHMSWKDLYAQMNLGYDQKMPAFFSLLSEHVHGLSTANLIYGNDIVTFEPIYGIASSLVGKLHQEILKVFPEEMNIIRPKMISVLHDENVPTHYIESLIIDYLNNNSKDSNLTKSGI